MLRRTAFDEALLELARESQRGAELLLIVQVLLQELRRVGSDAFLTDDESCMVRCIGLAHPDTCAPAPPRPPPPPHAPPARTPRSVSSRSCGAARLSYERRSTARHTL